MGLILPRWGLILSEYNFLPDYHLQPLFFTQPSHTLLGICTYTKKPTQKQPFSWPELASGQNELQSGQFGPNWAKCLKSGQFFLFMWRSWKIFRSKLEVDTYSCVVRRSRPPRLLEGQFRFASPQAALAVSSLSCSSASNRSSLWETFQGWRTSTSIDQC